MAKTARQLAREIAEVLRGSKTGARARFLVHGANYGGVQKEYTNSAEKAANIARSWEDEGDLITVFADPGTPKVRTVLVSNDTNGEMTVLDDDFAREAGLMGEAARHHATRVKSLTKGRSKAPLQRDVELEIWLRAQQEKAAHERHVMKQRRLGGAGYRGGRPRLGGRGDV